MPVPFYAKIICMLKQNLLFLPGWNIRADIFKPYIYNLQDKYNCHLIDTPLRGNYKIALQNILDYINKNKLEDLHILGWSMGGQLGILLANKIPLTKLFILNSAAIFSRDKPAQKNYYELLSTDFPKAVKYFNSLMGKLSLEDSILLKNNFIDDQENALKYLKELHTHDLSAEAVKITCPTVIIHTRGDEIIPYSEAEYLQQLIKNSKLVTFEDNFHFPFFNSYAKITAILNE